MPFPDIRIRHVLLLSCCLLGTWLLGACTTATDAREVSTADLLFGHDRLDEHLATRRQYLQQLQQRLTQMDEELLSSKARLFSVRRDLEAAEQPSRELRETLAQVKRLQQQSEALTDELLAAKSSIAALDQQIANQELTNQQMAEESQQARQRLQQLEQQHQVVQASIKRALKLRAEQIARETS